MITKLGKILETLRPDNLFGPPEVKIGKPLSLCHDREELVAYFEKYYPKSHKAVGAIVKRFGFKNRRILSIGSGVGMEEILFARHGNIIECIEPDATTVSVFKEFIGKIGSGSGEIIIHNCALNDFRSTNKFDLIYSSSPTDWMTSDFRQAIPNYYIDFFNHFGDMRCVVMIKLYSSCYKNYVLSNLWLPRTIAVKLSKYSNFRLREYWLADSGRQSAFIASNFEDIPSVTDGFKDIFMRGDVGCSLFLAHGQNNEIKPRMTDWVEPYLIVGRHLIRRIVRKISGVDVFSNW